MITQDRLFKNALTFAKAHRKRLEDHYSLFSLYVVVMALTAFGILVIPNEYKITYICIVLFFIALVSCYANIIGMQLSFNIYDKKRIGSKAVTKSKTSM